MLQKNVATTGGRSYWELVWVLAKTDFKMRYHGSFLGYIWAVLKPLLIFLILNFVFSKVIGRGAGIEHYSLQLITGIILWNFFSEGTMSGLTSLFNKANIITKVYFPRWIIIISSTLNNLLVFGMSLVILVGFFIFYQVCPSPGEIVVVLLYIIAIYILVISFSFMAAPLYLKFRDLSLIWEVLLQALFFAAPIIYPLYMIPEQYHKMILANPMGMLIHYSKMVLIEHRFPSLTNHLILMGILIVAFLVSLLYFNKVRKRIVEDI